MPVTSISIPAVVPRRHRIAALGMVLVVLALAVFASSPVLHHWLHAGTGDQGHDGCAVVLFATGVTLACAAIAVAAPKPRIMPLIRQVRREVVLTTPRFLHLPERAPPGW